MIKGFKIIEFNDIQLPLEKYHKEGAKPGVYLGFRNMAPFYSMREDGCTDWTGYPQSGKTELLLECLYNSSVFYGWKHLLLVPDIGDKIEIMAVLIHKATGKTFDKRYPNFIGIEEVWKECSWLLDHFYILEKTTPTATISPVEFWNLAVELKKTNQINTATIDSWKDLRHDYADYGGTYAQYLSNVLPIRNYLSETEKIHFNTVIHPKTPRRGKNGQIMHPQVDDMEGGAQWNNSGKTIISVHRETFDTNVADVMMLKVKPKVIGKRGGFTLNFDVAKSRYYELDLSNPSNYLYARKQTEEVKLDYTRELIDFTVGGSEYSNTDPF